MVHDREEAAGNNKCKCQKYIKDRLNELNCILAFHQNPTSEHSDTLTAKGTFHGI